MPDHVTDSDRSKQVQQSFDRVADRLGLRLEPAAGSGKVRQIGYAFAFGIFEALQTVHTPPPIGDADDAAVTAVLTGAASLASDQVLSRWREYYHDPAEAVGPNFLSRMDEAGLRHWEQSPKLAQTLADYPPFSPRQVQITNLRIVYVGDVRAAVTYHLEERFQNGKAGAGNASALLVKTEAGWRILVFTSDQLVDEGE
jgi:hypothetical protein